MRFWDRIERYREKGPWALTEPWGVVPAGLFHQLVSEILHPRLEAEGFERPSQSRWVRSRIPEVRDIFETKALKGDSYSSCWGVSVDFVPTLGDGKRWVWHRTVKSARMDLVFDPFDYHVDNRPWAVTRMEHAHDLPVAIREWVDLAVPESLAFFAAIQSLEDLEVAFAAKEERPFVRFGAESYRQHFLAHAFVLARLGRNSDARAMLARSQKRFPLEPDIESRVLAALSASA